MLLGLIKEVIVPGGGARVPYTISGPEAESSQEPLILQDSGRQRDQSYPVSSYLVVVSVY